MEEYGSKGKGWYSRTVSPPRPVRQSPRASSLDLSGCGSMPSPRDRDDPWLRAGELERCRRASRGTPLSRSARSRALSPGGPIRRGPSTLLTPRPECSTWEISADPDVVASSGSRDEDLRHAAVWPTEVDDHLPASRNSRAIAAPSRLIQASDELACAGAGASRQPGAPVARLCGRPAPERVAMSFVRGPLRATAAQPRPGNSYRHAAFLAPAGATSSDVLAGDVLAAASQADATGCSQLAVGIDRAQTVPRDAGLAVRLQIRGTRWQPVVLRRRSRGHGRDGSCFSHPDSPDIDIVVAHGPPRGSRLHARTRARRLHLNDAIARARAAAPDGSRTHPSRRLSLPAFPATENCNASLFDEATTRHPLANRA